MEPMLKGLNSDSFLLESQLTGQRPGPCGFLAAPHPPQGARLLSASTPSSVQLGLDSHTVPRTPPLPSEPDRARHQPLGAWEQGRLMKTQTLCRLEGPQESRAWLLTPNPGRPGLRLVPTFQNCLDT